MSAPTTASRADARRNRALVLAAAEHGFAESGTALSLVQVARRAGVGAGTVYRHFPTKAALLEAVLQRRIDHLAAVARRCGEDQDPGRGFFSFCRYAVDRLPRNHVMCDLLQSDDGWPKALIAGAGARFTESVAELLAAAQRAGAVRPDLTVADVFAIYTGCIAIQRLPGQDGRLATLVLEALRPVPSTGVTERPAAARNRDETSGRDETRAGAGVCAVCREPVRRAETGRPARYCSAACRQKAHRARRRAPLESGRSATAGR